MQASCFAGISVYIPRFIYNMVNAHTHTEFDAAKNSRKLSDVHRDLGGFQNGNRSALRSQGSHNLELFFCSRDL